MNSSRLPGKVMMELGGETVLSQVIQRCAAIENADVICCAIPEDSDCDQVATEANRFGAVVVRGPEKDVLGRYQQASSLLGCDLILRITSDCPLIDPQLCKIVIEMLKSGDCEFATNNFPRSWPHGLDCEAFSSALLGEAAEIATTPYQREHVTPWMRSNNPNVRIKNYSSSNPEMSRHRWTLDTPEDLIFFQSLFQLMPKNLKSYSYKIPLKIVKKNPYLLTLNTGEVS